jgi:hypothetical protein
VLITVLKEPPPTLDAESMKARGWSKTYVLMLTLETFNITMSLLVSRI